MFAQLRRPEGCVMLANIFVFPFADSFCRPAA